MQKLITLVKYDDAEIPGKTSSKERIESRNRRDLTTSELLDSQKSLKDWVPGRFRIVLPTRVTKSNQTLKLI